MIDDKGIVVSPPWIIMIIVMSYESYAEKSEVIFIWMIQYEVDPALAVSL